MKNLCVAAFAIMVSSQVYAQKVELNGIVRDADNNAVARASVHVLNTLYGTFTDDEGRFTLSLSPGIYELHITAVGFASVDSKVNTEEAGIPDIILKVSAHQLDDVVVTAQKEEENLQDVPFSTSALTGQQVQSFRMWKAESVTAIVPNLYSANPGDNRNVTSIRGIVSSSYDPAVATYIDGVNQFSLDTYISQLFDVDRIEVLRGPQGTLYGRNAMGGVINIHTRQPSNKTEGFAEINGGTYGQQRYSLGFKTPLLNNKLFFGMAGLYDRADGFYTNLYDNSDFDTHKSFTGNYYLTYVVNPNWALTLNVKNNIHRNDGAFPLSLGEKVYEVNLNATTTLIDDSFNGSFVASYAGSTFNFTSQTTYQSNHRYYDEPIDGDFSPIDGATIINNYGSDWNKVKVWTQEFKFNSPAASTSLINWTGGIYLFTQKNPVKQATYFGDDAAFIYSNPDSLGINTSKGSGNGAAIYGQGTYKMSDRFEVTVGARVDYEHKKQGALIQYLKSPNPLTTLLADTSATASYSAFSPKVSALYHISSGSNIYTVYSKGFRAGGLTQLSNDPSQAPLYEYKPEYSNSIEVGMKNTFLDKKIQLNAAVFYTKVTDAQVPTLVLPEALTVTRNTGELTSKGIEVEFLATLFEGLQLNYSAGYTDAQYSKLLVSQGGAEVDLEGNKQIFTPEVTSMTAMQYDLNLNKKRSLKWISHIEWMYLGEQYFDLANAFRQGPYGTINVRAGIAGKKWEAMFWGRNLGDKKYIAYAYDFGFGVPVIHLGEPLNWGISLLKRF